MSEEIKNNHTISPKRKRMLIGLIAVFLLIGILYLIYWIFWGHFKESTEDAYVSGNLVQLMPQISGTVTIVYTDDTKFVTEGQRLVEVDHADLLIALQRSSANLAQTVRQVRGYYENVRQNQATLVLRKADLDQAQRDLKRRIGLDTQGAVSSEEIHHYTRLVNLPKLNTIIVCIN